MKKLLALLLTLLLLVLSCSDKNDEGIEDDKLGFIDADVSLENTNLKVKAKYSSTMPGESQTINRAFENAPPMIPHTTTGFFPIKIDNNICLSCHLPEKAKEVKAKPLPETHFSSLRKQLILKDGKYVNPVEDLSVEKSENFNNAYFNCSQCHTPQAEIKIDISNLFTPEFRKEFGVDSSNLNENIIEGVKK